MGARYPHPSRFAPLRGWAAGLNGLHRRTGRLPRRSWRAGGKPPMSKLGLLRCRLGKRKLSGSGRRCASRRCDCRSRGRQKSLRSSLLVLVLQNLNHSPFCPSLRNCTFLPESCPSRAGLSPCIATHQRLYPHCPLTRLPVAWGGKVPARARQTQHRPQLHATMQKHSHRALHRRWRHGRKQQMTSWCVICALFPETGITNRLLTRTAGGLVSVSQEGRTHRYAPTD